MGTFSKQSLEELRSRIDLVEVLSPYLKLQRSGANYKALCPFHDEKTPSFMIQKGDTHYHCFGCGAHGDAIQFLMTHLKMSFAEAVETLADKFQVALVEAESDDRPKGPSKTLLKEALEKAQQIYQFALLHTIEGHAALDYLYARGIDLDFIHAFGMGYAPQSAGLITDALQEQGVNREIMEEAGLMRNHREMFNGRITIPIRDPMGSVIGFSARKFRPDTFGGKYINTPETPLFKKSKVLFGLSYCRKQIAKEKKALLVEGQIDAMRLIHSGYNWTVASQGTAFGIDQAHELTQLGARAVYIAFDGDTAGQEAAMKAGHFFQKEGVDVYVVPLPEHCDPDVFLQEKGPEEWQKCLDMSVDYLTFLVGHLSKKFNPATPAGKNELVQTIAKQIREWDHPLMVHEGLKKLARLTQTPESMLGGPEDTTPQVHLRRSMSVSHTDIDPDRILEADLLRWLLIMGEAKPEYIAIAQANLQAHHFRVPAARLLYERYLHAAATSAPRDLLALAIDVDNAESQLFLAEILQKKVNREKAKEGFLDAIQKILERHWMQAREAIKAKIYSGKCIESEVLELAKAFDQLKRERPQVKQEI
ncbi:MAG: primase [Chlamydiota bacterium]|jgi:DNA primase